MNLQSEQCQTDPPKLSPSEAEALRDRHAPKWTVRNSDGVVKISRSFEFKDFAGALAFVNRVGELAEKENHHPDIFFTWGRAEITTWTHTQKGLTKNDFILAAKVDLLTKP